MIAKGVPVSVLGPAHFPLPAVQGFDIPVADNTWVRYDTEVREGLVVEELLFEKAGPRSTLFFDPATVRAAVVTCGGLCPGLNNVIRSLVLELSFRYGVPSVCGIHYGYEGMNPALGLPPMELTPTVVADIADQGGTILGSSRGPQEPPVMVDFLVRRGINMLFCIGGDGTQGGAHALAQEILKRQLPIAVVGIPKTIDNDILFCDKTFGMTTAVEKATEAIRAAHVEARGARRGVGLVKVMGRDAGFIACLATVACQEVNMTLIPEQPFALEGPQGLLAVLGQRLNARNHAVIIVAEGAGQDLFSQQTAERDASGNRRREDIGPFLKAQITDHFRRQGAPADVKYIDPSYLIRGVPANCEDSMLCDQFARKAVHAAMAGRTDTLICIRGNTFFHVPIAMAIAKKKQVPLDGELWHSVLSATGQPARFGT